MPRLEGKSFDSPDETRTPEKAQIDSVTIGGLTFARETLEPGWRWSSHVKPTVGGESCQRRHVKIFVSGRQRNRTSSSNLPRRRGSNDHEDVLGPRAILPDVDAPAFLQIGTAPAHCRRRLSMSARTGC
jgi:hypothetical protein